MMHQHDMGELNELYMEIILDHYKFPRNRADLSHISEDAVHENPSCGDSVKLEVLFGEDGRIREAKHDGYGCAISTASASLLTENLPGKTREEAQEFVNRFIKVLRGEESPEYLEQWGDLAVFGGIVQFPLRVKCAALAWHALNAILEESDATEKSV